MKHLLAAICLASFIVNAAFSQDFKQDTILLLNSQLVYGRVIDTTNNLIKFQYVNKKEKQFESALEKERVFSIKYASGIEAIIYSPDTSNEEEFSIEDMRAFIKGQSDAREHFKTGKSFAGGVVTGVAGGVIFSPILLIASPLVPGAYSAINGSRWIKIKKMKGATASDLEKDTYLMGYSRVVRNKRIQSALKGGLIGLAAGIATMYTISALQK